MLLQQWKKTKCSRKETQDALCLFSPCIVSFTTQMNVLEVDYTDILILDFQPPELGEIYGYTSHLVYVTAAWPGVDV